MNVRSLTSTRNLFIQQLLVLAFMTSCRTTGTQQASAELAAAPAPTAIVGKYYHCDTTDSGGFFGLSSVDVQIKGANMKIHDNDNDSLSVGIKDPNYRGTGANAESSKFSGFDDLVNESGSATAIVSKSLRQRAATGKLTLRFSGEGFTSGNFSCQKRTTAAASPATSAPANHPSAATASAKPVDCILSTLNGSKKISGQISSAAGQDESVVIDESLVDGRYAYGLSLGITGSGSDGKKLDVTFSENNEVQDDIDNFLCPIPSHPGTEFCQKDLKMNGRARAKLVCKLGQ